MDLNLRNWIEVMKKEKVLKTVSKEVSTEFEIAAIGKKLEPDYGVMFNNVKGYDVPVITGLAGTREKMASSLSLTVEELMERFNNALSLPTPCSIVPSEGLGIKENIYIGDDVDIERILPACVHHEKDSGKYITSGMLIVKDPETGIRNVAIHRHEIKDKNHLGALLLPRHTHHIFDRAEKTGKPLEVALIIGTHPVLLLASQATTRLGIDEFEIAGSLIGKPVAMTKCETVDLEVPIECEYVLEGKILPNIRKDEGPFGEYPKTYGPKRPRHVIEITAITHRDNPIYHTIIPATMEHLLLGAIPREATMFQIVKQAVPSAFGVHLTPAGGCRYHVIIGIDKKNEGEAKNAIFAAFASSSEVKQVVVVDKDIDIFDSKDVEWAIANRVQANNDVIIVKSAMGNKLDPSSDEGVSDKMGIDATVPLNADPERFQKINIPMYDEIILEDYLD
ncbi:2,5-furandicarboxylate decarboxylase 1 [Dethiosulfatibacter aminovorans DSM 17477]|uniref:2,5-furandicarboxylate decarboxylase 1 n=1 Tax=Dethiosulfatibacter aminovorans DSM 17477 TaxID=1121476 RepID=A0A1M6C3H6_9FIRM|nr:UbiD family decarboxylase [Dethiosulfatibacter aminovorans]SHI55371.1 2,5-furandicarboxylate decarboxylase 1 [Dethiosulfatibacter aminovorans DSM 17477]